MKKRCNDPTYVDYPRYGGRGITLCIKWLSFGNFWRDMGSTYDELLTLDRIDNDKGYSVENCRWATKTVQANNRRTNRLIDIDGEIKTLAEWIRVYDLKPSTVRQRFYVYGWDIKKSLNLGGQIG